MNARMNMIDALKVIHRNRDDRDIVISSMGNAREWMKLGPLHESDFVLVPSAMGHATSFALGLALAQPSRRVIAMSGDGSLLMNLGSLVSIATEDPGNLHVVVFVNGVYEVTGGQPVPGSAVPLDYVSIATGCGLQSVSRLSDVHEWTSHFHRAERDHARITFLDVEPIPGAGGPRSPGNAGERARRFAAALRG
jgi:phosphonopyruvate decarboxylase